MANGKCICLATVEFEGLDINGGVGSYYGELSRLLSKNGWKVIVLYCRNDEKDISRFAGDYEQKYGIPVYSAIALYKESGGNLDYIRKDMDYLQAQSHIAHAALQALMSRYGYRFDLIEFSEWCAAGFVPVNMHKNFHCYGNARIIVKLHSPTHWIYDGRNDDYWEPYVIMQDYMERYSFENADIQVSPTRYLLDWCHDHGWDTRKDAVVCVNPLSLDIDPQDASGHNRPSEIIFFGRWEERKGIMEFLAALSYIRNIAPGFADKYSVTFIGKESTITKSQITGMLEGYKVNFLTFDTKLDAIKYLTEHARLVVIPSKYDNFPNTVIECMYMGIPFVTSRSGGIPEIIGEESELFRSITFNVYDKGDIVDRILEYMNYGENHVRSLIQMAEKRIREVTDPEKILTWYDEIAQTPFKERERKIGELPGMTAVIGVSDSSVQYLESTLRSLKAQSYSALRVIVIDSCTRPISEALTGEFPSVKYVRAVSDMSGILGQALPYVETQYVLEMAPGHIAWPGALKKLAESMENRPEVAALSCYSTAYGEATETALLNAMAGISGNGNYGSGNNAITEHFFRPLGPCLPLLFFQNTQGDSDCIYRTEAVCSIDGKDGDMGDVGDWGMWLKLISLNREVDVVRETLFYFPEKLVNGYPGHSYFSADSSNMRYIRRLVEYKPGLFYMNCYEGMHRLIRRSVGKQQCNPPEDPEWKLIQSSVLYKISVKLGQLANKYPLVKSALTISGSAVKKIVK